jgi:hypothetical protein
MITKHGIVEVVKGRRSEVFGFSGKKVTVYGRVIAWARGKSNLET